MLGDRPVFVEFIFATCTTICPVLSAGFASVQRKLGDDREEVLLVSLTIDPEHDGPEELRQYLDRYGAKSGWDFYTGTRKDIDEVMRAFDAFVPDKMSHRPLTFVHAPGAKAVGADRRLRRQPRPHGGGRAGHRRGRRGEGEHHGRD